MDRPLNLALFTDSLTPSGVGKVMVTLAQHLPQSRYTPFLICCDHAGTESLVGQMRPYIAKVARFTVRGDEDLPALPRLVGQLRKWQIDIFHNHIGATWEGDWGTIAASCAGVPLVVATDHVPCLVKLNHELERRRRVNRLLHRVFAVSESVRQSLVENSLVSERQAVTVENGVNQPVDLPSRAMARRTLGLPQNVPVALLLGRLTEQKDPAMLLRAVQMLNATGVPIHGVIAGDGWLRAELEQEAARLGIMDNIHFLGHYEDVPCLLAAADVLAMPSQFEGLPLAALEAMAIGIPVVGCDAPGIREVVVHNKCGWLGPIGDHVRHAEGLRKAVMPDIGRQWGASARARYLDQFTARHLAVRQDNAYQQALPPHLFVKKAAASAIQETVSRTRNATPAAAVIAEHGRLAHAARHAIELD